MKLFEFQAKAAFAEAGIPIPDGFVARTPQQARDAAVTLGCPVMIKSQMLRGGRGKLGLVKRAVSPQRAEELTEQFLASEFGVQSVLVERCASFVKEIYLSISMEPVSAKAMVMLCVSGGMEIEDLAKKHPERILRGYIDLDEGVSKEMLRELMANTELSHKAQDSVGSLIDKLFSCFCKYDAELAEINPVFLMEDDTVIAGDGKLVIDDNSLYRQMKFSKTREYFDNDMEYEASMQGIPYIQFDGDISLMCAGAGLTTTIYDLINYEGGKVANYLEFGGPNYTKAETAMRICLENKSSVILIVTFGTIARADIIAEGVVEACKKLHPDRPLVTCIRGTNEEKAQQMLREAGIECQMDTEEAVRRAVAYAKEARKQ